MRIRKVSTSAPASSRARAVSYSQLVPGKTGIRALGRARRTLGPGRAAVFSAVKVSMGAGSAGTRVGYTGSSFSA